MSNSKLVVLGTAIKSGKSLIKEVSVRKPVAGDLRGVKLLDFFEMDVDCLAKVLPRITTPSILDHDVYSLELADLAEFAKTVSSFLQPKSDSVKKESHSE